ncbi:MAG: hypothetical protein LM557_03425 [Desulfurococcaceae archaeon]|nr:hypothetical protein [Desulfurococcaceae archaeon]MCC6053087.1 hypothetical protein [Desulfurococcaceae archaeon]
MSTEEDIEKKPNWLLLKEAAETLYRSGKTTFTRQDLTAEVLKRDPSRSEMSLDFEIDLVTVNSGSRERYRDPEKLFLYRIERGKYTLYNPEEHGELEKYIGSQRLLTVSRKELIEEVLQVLEKQGYDVAINKTTKPIEPDIIAEKSEEEVSGIWVIDPALPLSAQYRQLAYAIGSSLLNKNYKEHIILVPGELYKRVPQEIVETLKSNSVRLAIIREERKYSIQM